MTIQAQALNTGSSSKPLTFDESAREIRENAQWMSGGVNSNFRLNISPTPLVFERGEGPYLHDVDGNRLIDYYLGMGPMILGHRPQSLCDAVVAQLEKGILFAGQTHIEAEASPSRLRDGSVRGAHAVSDARVRKSIRLRCGLLARRLESIKSSSSRATITAGSTMFSGRPRLLSMRRARSKLPAPLQAAKARLRRRPMISLSCPGTIWS